ncbi:helix-turn-helix domain-containing protein [Faecalimonas umbilicata]|nr:helix-turn-helix domain-containing protein [Faecalimonas umbilicata]
MFGEIIKTLRLSYNLSQVQLAGELSVSKQTISNWENNNILPSIEMLIKIARFFSVSTDYLLELDGRHYIEVTGLSDAQLAHIQQIIKDITGNKNQAG